MGNLQRMRDMNIQYKDLPEDERMEAYYNDYRDATKKELREENISAGWKDREPKEKKPTTSPVEGTNKGYGVMNLGTFSGGIPFTSSASKAGGQQRQVNVGGGEMYYLPEEDKFVFRGNIGRSSYQNVSEKDRKEFEEKFKYQKPTKMKWPEYWSKAIDEGLVSSEKGRVEDFPMNAPAWAAIQLKTGRSKEEIKAELRNATKSNESQEAKDGGNKSSTPKKGDVDGGYKFMGGDPSDQKNWKKI